MEGVHWGFLGSKSFPKRDRTREPGDGSPPVGARGKAPVRDLGDEMPQKLKQDVK